MMPEAKAAWKGESMAPLQNKQRSEKASGWVMPREKDNNIFLS